MRNWIYRNGTGWFGHYFGSRWIGPQCGRVGFRSWCRWNCPFQSRKRLATQWRLDEVMAARMDWICSSKRSFIDNSFNHVSRSCTTCLFSEKSLSLRHIPCFLDLKFVIHAGSSPRRCLSCSGKRNSHSCHKHTGLHSPWHCHWACSA